MCVVVGGERESVCVLCERRECVCERERERVCVCGVWGRECVCVRERERCVGVCVCGA